MFVLLFLLFCFLFFLFYLFFSFSLSLGRMGNYFYNFNVNMLVASTRQGQREPLNGKRGRLLLLKLTKNTYA